MLSVAIVVTPADKAMAVRVRYKNGYGLDFSAHIA